MSVSKVLTRDRFAAGANRALLEGHEKCFLAYLISGRQACDKFLHRISATVNSIRDVYDDGDEINHITISNRLNEKGKLAECGGNAGIVDIAIATTSVEIAESALDCILDEWRVREAAQIGKQLVAGQITSKRASEQLSQLGEASAAAEALSIRSPEQVLAFPRDERACMLGDRLLAKGQPLVIAGVGGLGKTRLLFQLLVALIIGRDWCGIGTHAEGARCMLFQTENGTARLQHDIEALKKWAGEDWKLVEEKLKIHTLETDNDSLLHLNEPENVRRLEASIRSFNPDVLAFDPLRDFGMGDLNSDADMSATLREIGRVARIGDPERAMILIHHAITGRAGVAKAFGLERTGFARNSKVLHTWARGMINVVPGAEDNNDLLVLTCGKNSNGKEFSPIAVRLNPDTMIYEVADDFDVEVWRQKVCGSSTRRTFRPEIIREIPWPQPELEKKQLVKAIKDETGCGHARAYTLIDEAKARQIIRFNKPTRTYAKI
jgi:AAA domain